MARALANDPAYLKAAFADLGLSEIPGSQHSARVLELFKLAGHPEIDNDETAWCAAAVGGWLKQTGFPNTGSLMARSYAKYGVACDMAQRIPRGAIVVWPRGAPPSGHVNICLDDDGVYLTCIGGNQGNGNGGGVTISRERKSHALSARLPVVVKANLSAPKPTTAPKRIQPEDGPPSDLPKSMATSKIGIAQVAAGTATTVAAGAQITSSMLQTTSETVAQVTDIATQAGTLVETTKVVVTIAPTGFWISAVHVLTSPVFLACVALVVVASCVLTWVWRRQHRQAGV